VHKTTSNDSSNYQSGLKT